MNSPPTPIVTAAAAGRLPHRHVRPQPVTAPRALAPVRRAVIRLEARRTTNRIVRELLAAAPAATQPALSARLRALTERYAELGGDPADLLR